VDQAPPPPSFLQQQRPSTSSTSSSSQSDAGRSGFTPALRPNSAQSSVSGMTKATSMSFHSSRPGGASGGFKTPAPPSHRSNGSRSTVVTPAVGGDKGSTTVGGRSSTTPRSTRTCVESLDTGTILGSIFKFLRSKIMGLNCNA
jgi:hypothetical protein